MSRRRTVPRRENPLGQRSTGGDQPGGWPMGRRAGAGLALLAAAAMGASVTARACPAPEEVTHLHLYGLWQARFEGLPDTATLQLYRSESHAEGVSGEIVRGGELAWLAGDVDEGEFTLEESTDGQAITAIWTGKVSENTCGMEIQGTWSRARDPAAYPFVLRKLPGWR